MILNEVFIFAKHQLKTNKHQELNKHEPITWENTIWASIQAKSLVIVTIKYVGTFNVAVSCWL